MAAPELSREERVLGDGLALLQQQAPEALRPNVQPRGYADRQLAALCPASAKAVAAALRKSAKRTRACGLCGVAGRAIAPDADGGLPRDAVEWLVENYGAPGAEEEGGEPPPLVLTPRWRLDLAARALVLDSAPFACPCCAIAVRPELLFELADSANASGGGGSPAAAALDAAVAHFDAQRRAGGGRLSLQDAAALAHTLQIMGGALPKLSVRIKSAAGEEAALSSKPLAQIEELLAGKAVKKKKARPSESPAVPSAKKKKKSRKSKRASETPQAEAAAEKTPKQKKQKKQKKEKGKKKRTLTQ